MTTRIDAETSSSLSNSSPLSSSAEALFCELAHRHTLHRHNEVLYFKLGHFLLLLLALLALLGISAHPRPGRALAALPKSSERSAQRHGAQLRRGGPSAGGGGRGARALGHGHHGGPGQNRGLELQSHGFGPGLAFGLSSLGAPTLRGGRSEEATDETAMRGGIAHEKRGEDADIISHIHYMP